MVVVFSSIQLCWLRIRVWGLNEHIVMIVGLIGFSGCGVGMILWWSIGASVEVWLQFFFGVDEFLSLRGFVFVLSVKC